MIDFTSEIRPIPHFPGYFVSAAGEIFSCLKMGCKAGILPTSAARRMSLSKNRQTGYLMVRLRRNGEYTTCTVHSLVLYAFKGPPPPGMVCRHLDGKRTNNAIDNLCWGTESENQLDRIAHGTDHRGEKQWNAKLTEDSVRAIRIRGTREQFIDLASEYKVNEATIRAAFHRKTWRHVA